jgi:hypothetical protein
MPPCGARERRIRNEADRFSRAAAGILAGIATPMLQGSRIALLDTSVESENPTVRLSYVDGFEAHAAGGNRPSPAVYRVRPSID